MQGVFGQHRSLTGTAAVRERRPCPRPSRQRSAYSLVLFALLVATATNAAEKSSPERSDAQAGSAATTASKVDFARDVKPILQRRCVRCHGAQRREGGLRFFGRDDLLEPNDSGLAAVVPGRADDSELFRRVTAGGDDRMPPEGPPLGADEIEILRRWIDAGVPWPSREEVVVRHWAYRKPQRPPLPGVRRPEWCRTPIDRFVLARLEQVGWSPSPEEAPARLLRRVYLDLIGLPPTVEEVDRFLADRRPDAYARVVDRLLASPRYGEHWARPWLDAARYADSNGYQADQLRSIWPFRDWVIDALNADMPFDRFTIEQIAGDLLPGGTLSQKVATGFHRCTTCNVEAGVDPEENRTNQVIDRVNTTATVWLGTTMECAQCHNHKYDPFTQRDYYQLFAFFNNTPLEVKHTGGVTYDLAGPEVTLPLDPARQREREALQRQLQQATARLERLRTEVLGRLPQWEADRRARLAARESAGGETSSSAAGGMLPEDVARALAIPAEERSKKQRRRVEEFFLSQQPEIAAAQKRVQQLRRRLDAIRPATTMVMQELSEPRETYVFKRGNFLDPTVRVRPDTPSVLHPFRSEWPRNRLGLARWLVDPENPLTPRVIVNRWWAEFFGRGIVETVEDFGTQGDPPTHPELLDWLAVELVEHGWSMKHIHRLIVLSATYRQSARVTPEGLRRDPFNRYYARGPSGRLPAEVIRDNALAIVGLLSDKMGGPPVYPPQPENIWRHIGRNAPKYVVASDEDRYRRGVYTIWRRSAPYPSFVNFDAPDRAACVVKRPVTNTPLQALTLLNDPAFVEAAAAFAHRVLSERPSAGDRERIRYAFRCCVAREPTDDELAVLEAALHEDRDRFRADPERVQRLAALKPYLADHADGAELAAWFYMANTLLNLHETICK